MRLETITYDASKGAWSLPGFPQAMDSDRTLVVAFGAPELIEQPKPLQDLKAAFPRAKVVGCSSAGEIAGTSVRDHSLSVAVAKFDHTDLQIASLEVTSAAQSFTAGQSLAKQLARPGLRAVFVLSEGLDVNGSELVRGLNSVLDPSVVVTGGLSGDGTAFKRTWVALGDKLQSHLLVAVGLYGEHVVVGHGSKGGWDKFGPERVVTKSSANVLFELDNKPALALYKEYLGDKASGLPATGLLFPLALRSHAKDDKVLVRTLLAVDEAKQSMTFAGDLPQGSLVQLMKADYDRLIGGASGAAQSAKQIATAGSGATLALAISCVGRRLVLGERTEEEVEAVLDVLPKGSQIVGFYSYGEISPYATGQCDLHNQTMTLTTLSESPTPLPRVAAPAAERAAPGLNLPPAKPAPRPNPTPAVAAPTHAAQAKAGNGAAHPGNGKAPAPMGALDLDGPSYEPGTPRGAPATGTVKMPMRGFRVESFSYDAARGKWSVPGMPQALDSERTLIVAFGAPELLDQPKPFQELRRSFPRSKLVGCSSAGEIAGTAVRDHSLSVAVARFDHTDLATASLQVAAAGESFSAGQTLARQLQKPGLRAVFVLSEGLNVNGSELVRGLNAALEPGVVVTGGLSGDGTAFKRTWVALGDKLQSGLIVAVGFYGEHLVVGHGSKGGWDKFGPERVVTKSMANVLFELDNKPALALYKEYLGDKASGLPATGLLFPLALRSNAKDDKVLVRTLLAVDEAKQSMTFAGDLPQGSLVQLMKADYDRLIAGASGAAQSAKQLASSGQGGTLAVAVSCVGRRLVLGERTEEEVEAVLDVLPQGSQIVGFYSYGEISPYGLGQCDLHNQTMTLTTFSESPAAVARTAPPVAPAHGSPTNPGAATYSRRPPAATPMPPSPHHAPPPFADPATAPATAPASAQASAPASVMTPTLPLVAPTGPDVDTVADARPVRLTVNADPVAGLSFSKKTINGVMVVSFAGRLSEQFQGARVGTELAGTVVLDLSGVSRITSFGVREWLQMLQEAENRVDALYLARCSEAVSNQLTMIRRFAGKGQVVSFYAPYLCTGCGTAFGALVDCVRDAESIRNERPPDATCPRCHKPGQFDDDPRTYLTFGGQATRVPEDVRRAIASLDPEVAFEALEKRIDGDATRVRVASALDGTLRWTRVLEGVEGDVSIDLSGVPTATEEGMQHLLEGLGAVDTEVRVLRLEGIPTSVLTSLAEAVVTRPKLDVVSARVDGFCATCNATRTAELRLDGNLDAIIKGQLPELPCKRCHGPLTVESAVPALRAAAKALGKRKRPASAVAQAPRAPSRMATATEPGMRTSPSPSRALATAGTVVAAIVVLGGGAAVLTMRGRPILETGPSGSPPQVAAPAAGAQAQPAAAAVAAAAASPNGWRSETGLLPGWADNPVAVQGGNVYVVGRGSGGNEEEALAAARAAATDRLVGQMLAALQGKPIADVVRAAGADAAGENAASVAERFQRQLGAAGSLERTETVVRAQGGHPEMVARYVMGQDAFKAAVDRYAKVALFRGVTVAPFFPALERTVRTEGEVVVVASKLPDVKPGDVLLSLGGRPIPSLEALNRIALEVGTKPPSGGLQLQLERGGEPKTINLGKAAKALGPGK